jgi:signal peptidase I
MPRLELPGLLGELINTGRKTETPRGTVAEWTVTILLLLFGTTTLVQAFVIPTGSMEDTLLIGDHLLVDKLSYAPPGPVSKHLLPYTEVKRGDIIVFRYPIDIRQTFVKRVIGVPKDRIRIEKKQVFLNGKQINEPYKYHKTEYLDSYRDNFPSEPNMRLYEPADRMLKKTWSRAKCATTSRAPWQCVRSWFPKAISSPWETTATHRSTRVTGASCLAKHHRQAADNLLVFDAPTDRLASPDIGLDHILDLAQNFFSKTRWKRTFNLIRGFPTGS